MRKDIETVGGKATTTSAVAKISYKPYSKNEGFIFKDRYLQLKDTKMCYDDSIIIQMGHDKLIPLHNELRWMTD